MNNSLNSFTESKTQLQQNTNSTLIISAYGPKIKVTLNCDIKTDLTKQSFKDECDINVIMSRYSKTGVLDFVNKHQGNYGDTTGIDFQFSMQQVAEAQTLFNELPSSIRDRFGNDPAAFLDFVHNPSSISEMHAMGLLRPDYQPPVVDLATGEIKAPAASAAPGPSPAPKITKTDSVTT